MTYRHFYWQKLAAALAVLQHTIATALGPQPPPALAFVQAASAFGFPHFLATRVHVQRTIAKLLRRQFAQSGETIGSVPQVQVRVKQGAKRGIDEARELCEFFVRGSENEPIIDVVATTTKNIAII